LSAETVIAAAIAAIAAALKSPIANPIRIPSPLLEKVAASHGCNRAAARMRENTNVFGILERRKCGEHRPSLRKGRKQPPDPPSV
jgi:hypothetical protein